MCRNDLQPRSRQSEVGGEPLQIGQRGWIVEGVDDGDNLAAAPGGFHTTRGSQPWVCRTRPEMQATEAASIASGLFDTSWRVLTLLSSFVFGAKIL